ncbi:MAG: flagellar export protein FliJ [Planctomycetaceae bacterium]|nr:MAG: flagellar export protein FliJ [Planctomycetaceae bacterium]
MFNFKLQPVLDYRKQVEEKILSELAEIKRCLDCEVNKLKKIQEERRQEINDLEEMGNGRLLNPVDASLCSGRIVYLACCGDRQKAVIGAIEQEHETKRKELVEALKKRKIMDIIRGKKLKEYNSEISGKEEKTLDELGGIQYNKGVRH